MLGCAQFVMRKAKVVSATDQIHASFQRLQALSGMTTFAREGSQPLTHRPIEPLNKGGIEHASPFRECQEFLGSFERSLCHASSDLDNTLVLSVFDNSGDQKLRPPLERGSSSANSAFDLVAKRAPNTAGIGCPAIGADQNRPQRLATRSNLREPIDQPGWYPG